jgi:hypothetical protein
MAKMGYGYSHLRSKSTSRSTWLSITASFVSQAAFQGCNKPTSSCHRWTVLSALAVANVCPSGLKLILQTIP